MYKAIIAFTDLQDANHIYHVGDIYPRDGFEPSQERIDELSGSANKVGCPLITEIAELDPDGKPKEEHEKPVKKVVRRTSKK